MDLVNQTPVPIDLTVADIPDEPRAGMLTAKATFRIVGQRVELDTQAPLAIVQGHDEYRGAFVPPDVMP